MRVILFVCLYTLFLHTDEIKSSFNGNQNTVINVVKEILGKEREDKIVNRIVFEITAHFNKEDKKLLEKQKVIESLSRAIERSAKTSESLTILLEERRKQRVIDLAEIERLKKEQYKSDDIDFKKIIEEAEQALEDYDSEKYRKILKAYQENKKYKELRKNMGVTHYLSAKSYFSDFYFEKAKDEIETAVALDRKNGDYHGWYGLILLHLSEYNKSLKYLEESLKISKEIGDVAGLCATLFNMGHIHIQNDEVTEAVEKWVTVYKLAKKINLAQALDALENLAGQLGLEGGLESWEALANQIDEQIE